MPALLKRDERAGVAGPACRWEIATIHGAPHVGWIDDAGVRREPFECAGISAVTLLAAHVGTAVRRPVPRLKVIPPRRSRIGEVAVGTAALWLDLGRRERGQHCCHAHED